MWICLWKLSFMQINDLPFSSSKWIPFQQILHVNISQLTVPDPQHHQLRTPNNSRRVLNRSASQLTMRPVNHPPSIGKLRMQRSLDYHQGYPGGATSDLHYPSEAAQDLSPSRSVYSDSYKVTGGGVGLHHRRGAYGRQVWSLTHFFCLDDILTNAKLSELFSLPVLLKGSMAS